jgi:hypothetical protein
MSKGYDRTVRRCHLPDVARALPHESAGGYKFLSGAIVDFDDIVDFTVLATLLDDCVVAVAGIPNIGVYTGTADEDVVAFAANQGVVVVG